MARTLPWFRLYSEAVDDPKLKLLAFEDRWHFIAILCCKCQGIIGRESEDMTRRMVAVKLGLDLRELDEVARRLGEVGLIDQETFEPLAWDERQYKSDNSTERVREYRKRKQKQQRNNAERSCNVSETPQETEQNRTEQKPQGAPSAPDRFPDFWSAYPKKREKKKARDAWKRKRLDSRADEIIADVRNRIEKDGQWLDGYVPHPTTYINGERWDDEIEPRKGTDGKREPTPPHLRALK